MAVTRAGQCVACGRLSGKQHQMNCIFTRYCRVQRHCSV